MQQYHELLRHVLLKGEEHSDRTGTGTRSVFGYQMRFPDVEVAFPLMTTKKIPLRWVAEELFWFLSGSTNERDLRDKGVDIWEEWATAEQCAKFNRPAGDLGPVYGKQWRDFGYTQEVYPDMPGDASRCGIDQIAELLTGIQQSPSSRRLIVSGWHPYDQKRVALPPCHTLWQVKCHDDVEIPGIGLGQWPDKRGPGMSLHLYARSIDSFLGLPFNIASYALLLKLLAWSTDRIAKDLVISFGDLHIYNNHISQCSEQLGRRPKPLPHLTLDDSLRGRGLPAVLGCTWDHVRLYRYNPDPAIAADVSV